MDTPSWFKPYLNELNVCKNGVIDEFEVTLGEESGAPNVRVELNGKHELVFRKKLGDTVHQAIAGHEKSEDPILQVYHGWQDGKLITETVNLAGGMENLIRYTQNLHDCTDLAEGWSRDLNMQTRRRIFRAYSMTCYEFFPYHQDDEPHYFAFRFDGGLVFWNWFLYEAYGNDENTPPFPDFPGFT